MKIRSSTNAYGFSRLVKNQRRRFSNEDLSIFDETYIDKAMRTRISYVDMVEIIVSQKKILSTNSSDVEKST